MRNLTITQVLSMRLRPEHCCIYESPRTNFRRSCCQNKFEDVLRPSYLSHQFRMTHSWVDGIDNDWIFLAGSFLRYLANNKYFNQFTNGVEIPVVAFVLIL